MAFAEHTFRLGRQMPDGATEGSHRSAAARQWAALGKTGAAAASAGPVAPPFPPPLEYLWGWFASISRGLAFAGWGYPTITWGDIDAWARLTAVRLAPWEAETLAALGQLRARILNEPRPDKKQDVHQDGR